MNFSRLFISAFFLTCFFFSTNAFSANDATAPVVKLRTSCKDGSATLNNCFTSMTSVINWINNTRKPSAAAPLIVEVGPGTFDGFTCSFTDVSFRGSGRDITTIGKPLQAAIQTNNISPWCTRLHVQDLTVTGGFPAPVYWQGGGSSTWVNVRLAGSLYGWSETNCPASATSRPVHRWWSSSVESAGKVAYAVQCSENWFYGSEFITKGVGLSDGIRGITARSSIATHRPEVHVYGSVIRVMPDAGVSFPDPSAELDGIGVIAIAAGQNAEVHVHGTGIDVIGNDMPNNVGALAAYGGGSIHADSSAFNMSTAAGGSIVRVTNQGGHVHAPYLWQHIPDAPLGSVTGADMTTVTSGTSDGHPHTLIYDTSCASTWYDAVDRVCKP